ncbi:EamA family transporter [Neobacillus sp. MM2021_6]|uniref:DMT family transporter n=1 Tax=Bacillaceae TaxID=186817 RepID=UPI00140E38F4|nr:MULTISPECIES: EamA family transporter [Bacillaceae]MBO0960244.1 EamA family transporter [Neobacillus sp. MM2021_6]NHC19374.1 EamA family transporter [Bacillus sp. MM2020_4]
MNSHSAALPHSRAKGIVLVLIAATFWGVSGTVAQYLFHQQGFSTNWLVVTRLIFSGIGLLLFSQTVGKQSIWSVWKNKQDVGRLIIFGIIGMFGVQYTYFAAIEHGNAATATVLQYLAPVIIASYLFLRAKSLPGKQEVLAIILALLGTFLLVTKGSVHSLSITGMAFFWGILSAFALAFYTLYPGGLLSKWGSLMTVGWGMTIGGIGFSFIHPPWKFQGDWSLTSFLAVVFVVICGTLIAFFCYMESLKYISASDASLLACVEPLSAAFLAVAWLHVSFGAAEWIGSIFIIATIFILSIAKNNKKQTENKGFDFGAGKKSSN